MNIQEKIAKIEKELGEIKKELKSDWTKFTFQGKDYEISQDLGEMDWHEAGKACEKLGGQLPPRWLLCAIADEPELADIKKTFDTGFHWSGTETTETLARDVISQTALRSTSNKTNDLLCPLCPRIIIICSTN
jgi:hypothetical protein